LRASHLAACALFSLSVAVCAAHGQTCIDYSSFDPYDVPRLWDHPGYATPLRAAVNGATAFVIDEDGLKVLDVSSLPEVVIIASLPSSIVLHDVASFKDRLYLASEQGLRILDIVDPTDPKVLKVVDPGTPFRALLLDGGRLFVAGGSTALSMDVAWGEDVVTARWSPSGVVNRLARVGDVLWSSNLGGDLIAYDVTDTRKVARIDHDLASIFSGDLLAYGGYLFAGDINSADNRISVIDVSDPTAPQVVTRFATNRPMAVSGTRLIAGGEIFDVTDPTAPVFSGAVTPFDMVLPTTPAVGLVKGFGWESVALEAPPHPTLAAAAPLAADFGRARIHGELLIAGNGVWSLDTGGVPAQLSANYTADLTTGGWESLDGDLHYQTRTEGVLVADMSDPAAPRKLGVFRPRDLVVNPGNSFHMAVIDGMGYYVYQGVPGFTGRPTMAVFDMGDPVHPKQVGELLLNTVFGCVDIAKVGDVLFIMTSVSGCRMADVSDPRNPVFIGSLPGRAPSTKLMRYGDLLGLVMSGSGVDLYDVSDPFAPVYKFKIPTDAAIEDVAIADGYAFTLAGDMIHVFDIDGPPFLLASFPPPAAVAAMHADPGRLLIATRGGGWYAYAPDCGAPGFAAMEFADDDETLPDPIAVLTAAPNPFNPRTMVSWVQERSGPVLLTVHDPAGRRVATLADGHYPAGRHDVVWNGDDDAGRGQATGAYMVSLRRDDGRLVRKVLLIR